MERLKRLRPSPAMVVALTALTVALAGTAYAAQTINGGAIKKRTISGAKLKHNTLNGFQIKTAKIGTVPTAKRATHTYWAVVRNPPGARNSSMARASHKGMAVAEGGGAVVVSFPVDVSDCANLVSANSSGTPIPGAAIAQTNNAVGNPRGIEVHTRDDKGNNTDADFHLVVICL